MIAADPAQEGLVGQANQVLQYAEEMINNTSKQVQKLQRDAAIAEQDASVEGQPQQGESSADSKMQEHQVKMMIAQEKAELDMKLKQAKFEQEQAMRDAKNVVEMREAQQ